MKRNFQRFRGSFDQSRTQRKGFGGVKLFSAVIISAIFANTALAEVILEEVVVTAQKRTENLQDVPVAVTAISADTIERNRIVSIEDISNISTSVNWQRGLTSSNSTVSIRGMGTINFGTGVESSVGIVQDGVVLSKQNEAFGDLFNLDRIEVLRGPQGTLFGKNTSAGVIHLITKAPTEEFEGKADLFYGSFDEVIARGTMSGALSESGNVLGRVTAYYRTVDGNVNNLYDGSKLNGIDKSYGIRAKLYFEASDNLNFMLIGDYSNLESDCCAEPYRTLPPNTNIFGIPDPAFNVNAAAAGAEISESSLDTSIDAPAFGNYEGSGVSLQINYDFAGDIRLTSITSVRQWEEQNNNDIDWSPISVFQINGGNKEQDTFTQEIRLNSTADNPLQYVAGFFYYDNKAVNDFNRTFFEVLKHDFNTTNNTLNYAFFGNLQYSLDTGTTLAIGGRWQREEIDYQANAQRTGFNTADYPDLQTSFKDTDTTFKASIQQSFGESSMVYGSFSQGYKGQALDLGSGLKLSTAELFPIAPETVDSWEIGLKSEFLDHRLRLNIVGFYSDFKNFQTQAFDSEALTFRIINAGDVRSKGIEIESQFAASDSIVLTFNGTFQDIEIINMVDVGCYAGQTEAQGCLPIPDSRRKGQSVVGGTLPNAPDTKIYLGGDWTGLIGNFEGHANLNYTWQSEVLYELNQNPLAVQDSFGVLNMSFGMQPAQGGFEATLYVNNVLDQSYVSSIRAPGGLWGGSTGTVHQIPRGSERTWGIRVGYTF